MEGGAHRGYEPEECFVTGYVGAVGIFARLGGGVSQVFGRVVPVRARGIEVERCGSKAGKEHQAEESGVLHVGCSGTSESRN